MRFIAVDTKAVIPRILGEFPSCLIHGTRWKRVRQIELGKDLTGSLAGMLDMFGSQSSYLSEQFREAVDESGQEMMAARLECECCR